MVLASLQPVRCTRKENKTQVNRKQKQKQENNTVQKEKIGKDKSV